MPISESDRIELIKKQYGLFENSAVQICSWTKRTLQEGKVCYKEKFYGIHTHKCMQFSPTPLWCTNACIYCWRPVELMNPSDFKERAKPQELIEGLIEERRKLLSGFGGREGMDLDLWKDSLIPDHFAISLSGEPTIYRKLPELITLLKEDYQARSIFLVSNGTFPEMIEKLARVDALPSQLYISAVASNEELYKEIVKPKQIDAWKRFNKSLQLLKTLSTRTVVRFTLIKGFNDKNITELAELFEKTQSDFIEVKAYMHIGYSRKRLDKSNMPLHTEVKEFTNLIIKFLPSYELVDEHKPSRILLLKNKNTNKPQSMFSV